MEPERKAVNRRIGSIVANFPLCGAFARIFDE
jgi:hypothetical protein